jgi:hypothetical protein
MLQQLLITEIHMYMQDNLSLVLYIILLQHKLWYKRQKKHTRQMAIKQHYSLVLHSISY